MASANRLIEVFSEAKARPAGAEREHFLAESCADDPTLKEQVLALLQAHEGAGDFLNNPQAMPAASPLTEKPGDRIGRYKLLEQIGEGGCGVVYMAEQEEPVRRRVALKVIKLGMDTKQVIARFEAERQALALMDHPNIAKVLDAGATDTGRPFFVMELVRGIKITDYCDQNNLTTHERLELFIQVCQAVQHAHQKGIIHRDIKPSNILVTQHDAVAVPKIIDFGIAKATVGQLTDKTVFTAFAQFIGTPAYMSPEQAQMSGLDIDTRADIYSLGVLLYELLTGHTPFEAKELLAAGMDEMRRKIREDEPAKPSTRLSTMQAMDLKTVASRRHVEPPNLIHLIRGDLDWLVMKCLEKDRTRRYETANGLAMDLQRHLNDEPVIARPPSTAYRFQKLVRRNKLAFAAAAAISTVLVVGVLVSSLEAIRATYAEREQSRLLRIAEAKEQKSQQVAAFLTKMLEGVGPSKALGRDTTMLREILDKTAERIGKDLTNQPEVEIELRLTLADTYHQLGLYQPMEAMARQSLQVARSKLGEESQRVADSLATLGNALTLLGQLDEAEKLTREALAMRRKMLGNQDPAVARSLYRLGEVLNDEGRLPEAETQFREALAMEKKLLGDEVREVADSMVNLGNVLVTQNKLPEAEMTYREALVLNRKLYGNEHPEVAVSIGNLARVLNLSGKLPEAETLFREALAMAEKLDGHEHPDVAVLLVNLGVLLENKGQLPEAETMFREALRIGRKRLGDEHPKVAEYAFSLGQLLAEEGKLPEAETVLREALSVLRKNSAIAPSRETAVLGNVLHHLADVLRQRKALPEARLLAMEASLLYPRHSEWPADERRHALEVLTDVFTDLGDLDGLETFLRDALEKQKKLLGNVHPDVVATLRELVGVLHDRGKLPEAAATAREAAQQCHRAMAHYENLKSDLDLAQKCWSFTISYEAIGGLLKEIGQTQEAEKAYRDTQVLWRKLVADFNTEDHRFHLAVNDDALGNLLSESGRTTESLELKREAQAIWLKLVVDFNMEDRRVHLGWTDDDIGYLLAEAGRFDEAAEAYRQALEVWTKLVAEFNKGEHRNHLTATTVSLAATLQTAGKRTEAAVIFREVAEHADAPTLNALAWPLATDPDAKLRDGPSAVTLAEKAVAGTNRQNPIIMDTLAAAYAEAGQFSNAVRVQQEAIALLQTEAEKTDYASRLKLYASNSPYRDHGLLVERTSALLDKGKFAEAEPLARECLTLREKQLPDDWQTFDARSLLGASLLGLKQYAEAEPLLLAGYEGMKQREDKIPADAKVRLRVSLQRVVLLYEATGQAEKAAEWNRKLVEFDSAEAAKKTAAPKP